MFISNIYYLRCDPCLFLLFQNRYKSILCEKDLYLKQLVGYIHLNPFRAGMVETVQALRTYPFTGHCALMGKKDIVWQDTAYVLALFGKTVNDARKKSYADYVSKCAGAGRRPELTGAISLTKIMPPYAKIIMPPMLT